ncbi:hypothetical protein BLOT_007699 [Blomia tropicalis]|nr:hypothetical protein BLOT_007699 [Blomia tropicalis]
MCTITYRLNFSRDLQRRRSIEEEKKKKKKKRLRKIEMAISLILTFICVATQFSLKMVHDHH